MPEGLIKAPFGFEIGYFFKPEQHTWIALAKRVYTSPSGNLFARQVTPVVNRDRTLGFDANAIKLPSRTKTLYLTFHHLGRETPPEDFSTMTQTLRDGLKDYLDFLRVLSDPNNFRGITIFTALSDNSVMTNFAVRKLGFHYADRVSLYNAEDRSGETLEIFGIREQLIARKKDMLSWEKTLSSRYN